MKKAILTGLTALLMVTGCASTNNLAKETAKERGYATRQEAMELLGIRNPGFIKDINGYKMHIGTVGKMRGLAALQSGKGYVTQDIQVDKILKKADTDGNMIIDSKEEKAIIEKVYSQYTNQRR